MENTENKNTQYIAGYDRIDLDPDMSISGFNSMIKQEVQKTIDVPSITDEQKDEIIAKVTEVLPFNYLDIGENKSSDMRFSSMWHGDELDGWMSERFRTDDDVRNHRLPETYQDASKFFVATCFVYINDIRKEYGDKAATTVAETMSEKYLRVSDNVITYSGGTADYMELLSLSMRGSVTDKAFSRILRDEIMYANSFTDSSSLEKLNGNKDAVELIHLLDVECTVALNAAHSSWANDCITNTIEAFRQVINKPGIEPMVRIMAEDKIDIINNEINWLNDSNVVEISKEEYDALYEKDPEIQGRLKQQAELHKMFPKFNEESNLVLVAPGVCADMVRGQILEIICIDGRRMPISDWEVENDFGIKEDEAYLLQIAHRTNIKDRIDSELGIELNKITLDAQIQLLRFAIEAGNDRYTKLVGGLSKVTVESDKLALIESFLSLQFGDDFGDNILSIVEHAKTDESSEILKIINSYREISKNFGDQYRDFDPDLATASENAMNERLADLLVIAESVAKNGRTTVDISPGKNSEGYINDGRFDVTVESVGEVIEVMQLFLKSQQILQDVLSDKNTRVVKAVAESPHDLKLGYQTYRFLNDEKGFAQLHVRERGSTGYDRFMEYGNASGTEATISWLVNPIDPYRLPSAKDPDAISVRFDREGRSKDESAGSKDRSPIRDDGIISLDIGAVLGMDSSRIPVKLGRIIAAGNELRSQQNGTDFSLNHNTNYFDQKYGTADNFEKLVEYVRDKVEQDYKKPIKSELAKLAIGLRQKSRRNKPNADGLAS